MRRRRTPRTRINIPGTTRPRRHRQRQTHRSVDDRSTRSRANRNRFRTPVQSRPTANALHSRHTTIRTTTLPLCSRSRFVFSRHRRRRRVYPRRPNAVGSRRRIIDRGRGRRARDAIRWNPGTLVRPGAQPRGKQRTHSQRASDCPADPIASESQHHRVAAPGETIVLDSPPGRCALHRGGLDAQPGNSEARLNVDAFQLH